MANDDLVYLSIAEAAALVARREVSPLELTDACIARAEALDGRLHAFITQTFDSARREARAAADEVAAGKHRGPLHGIPFAIKDLYETAGVLTTGGSKLREELIPKEDARAVALLKQAGAVMLGKLNLHEWAMGGTNVNYFFPTPVNPWDTSRVTGGSSGGSALALAAGFCFGSLGTDTRGSIRIPAALCGIGGLKPTYGRVSLRGVIPLVWSLDQAGPMARSAADCALILNAIAGFDGRDPTSAEAPVDDYAAALEPPRLDGVRIGVPRGYFFDPDVVDPEVALAVGETRDVFRALGAEVDDIDFPDPAVYLDNQAFGAEYGAYHEERLRERPEELSEAIRARVEAALKVSGADYARARWRQQQFRMEARQVFRSVDLVLTPTSPIVAMPIAEVGPAAPGAVLGRNTSPFNHLHVPAVSVPCGYSSGGLPIGLQIAGRWWEEGLVLRAANAYQRVTDWHKRRPPL